METYATRPSFNCLPLHKNNRSSIELLALILEAVKNNCATRYPLMKYTGINYAQLEKYLQLLIRIGFIKQDVKEYKVSYEASGNGLAFLRQYNVLRDMLLNACYRNDPDDIIYEKFNESDVQQLVTTNLAAQFVKRLK